MNIRAIIDEAANSIIGNGVYVVHIDVDADFGVCRSWQTGARQWLTVQEFVRDYDRGGLMKRANRDGRFLGIVHEDGAFLVKLPPAAAEVTAW